MVVFDQYDFCLKWFVLYVYKRITFYFSTKNFFAINVPIREEIIIIGNIYNDLFSFQGVKIAPIIINIKTIKTANIFCFVFNLINIKVLQVFLKKRIYSIGELLFGFIFKFFLTKYTSIEMFQTEIKNVIGYDKHKDCRKL